MAAACAAAELLQNRVLGVDLVFLIEGEEETGSAGFIDAIKEHKVRTSLYCAGIHMFISITF
jgi:di- and tripeptidase